MELSALDIQYLVRELQLLCNARITRIYQPQHAELLFQLHSASAGKQFLRIIAGTAMLIAAEKSRIPETPSGYCMQVRKLLEGGIIRAIAQLDFERVVEFQISVGGVIRKLYAELFGKGNIIVTDADSSILSAMRVMVMRDRTIRTKERYALPPQRAQLSGCTPAEFAERLSGEGPVAKRLAVCGLGGVLAEELCARARIAGSRDAKTLTGEELAALHRALENLRDEEPDARVVFESEIPILALPFAFQRYAEKPQRTMERFSTAVAMVLDAASGKQQQVQRESLQQAKIAKLSTILKLQGEQLAPLEREAAEEQRKGELLYERYGEVKELLSALQQAFANKRLAEAQHGRVTATDAKRGTATIELT